MSWLNRQSPSVTMSSPATSCSRRYADSASTYCSRNREITIASRNDRFPRFSVYQLGRGSEPVIVVGMTTSLVALSIGSGLLGCAFLGSAFPYHFDRQRHGDLAMQLERHRVRTNRLDRLWQNQLPPIDLEALGLEEVGDIAGSHRAIELLGVADAAGDQALDRAEA